jgi:hypothetical protein
MGGRLTERVSRGSCQRFSRLGASPSSKWPPLIDDLGADEAARSSYAFQLRLTVALSVGAAIVLGVFRILRGWPIHYLIIAGYAVVIAMTFASPDAVVGIAFDSGGVTTSTVTVPLVTALGVGLATSIRGRDPLVDGFGMIALASLTPMIFVMLFGIVRFGVRAGGAG